MADRQSHTDVWIIAREPPETAEFAGATRQKVKRLLLAEGKVQKSPEGVLHLMVEHLTDRSADLSRLYEDEAPLPAPTHRHPRDVRILPPSRDFH